MPLRVIEGIPDGLLALEARDLHTRLPGPTLLRVAGAPGAPALPLFVSVLLHGNETSGWDGLRRYLQEQPQPARDLIIFIGNVAAAAREVRALPDQADFNRIWRDADGPGGALAAAVQAALAGVELFAAVDLHNNTGHNPWYSVVTDLEPHTLGLAYLFSDRAVFVEEPDTVLTRTFEGRCPAVALEVGPVGDPRCADRVYDYLTRCLELDAVPVSAPEDFRLFQTRVRVHVRPEAAFRFEGDTEPAGHQPESALSLVLTGGMEAVNFHELPAGSSFGAASVPVDRVLQVLDVDHRDVTADYFAQQGGEILLRQSVVPAMYTTDAFVVRQDCLCYFMEQMSPG